MERQLAEEKRKVQALEKKMKMTDLPLSEVKDDTRLRQHEKEILLQEVIVFSIAHVIYLFVILHIVLHVISLKPDENTKNNR